MSKSKTIVKKEAPKKRIIKKKQETQKKLVFRIGGQSEDMLIVTWLRKMDYKIRNKLLDNIYITWSSMTEYAPDTYIFDVDNCDPNDHDDPGVIGKYVASNYSRTPISQQPKDPVLGIKDLFGTKWVEIKTHSKSSVESILVYYPEVKELYNKRDELAILKPKKVSVKTKKTAKRATIKKPASPKTKTGKTLVVSRNYNNKKKLP